MSGGYLLDTHVLLWSRVQPEYLSRAARDALADDAGELLVSAVSGYEIALKHMLGKLPVGGQVLADLIEAPPHRKFRELPITLRQSVSAGQLPSFHRDPFDRLLAAQALGEGAMLISADTVFDRFGVPRLW